MLISTYHYNAQQQPTVPLPLHGLTVSWTMHCLLLLNPGSAIQAVRSRKCTVHPPQLASQHIIILHHPCVFAPSLYHAIQITQSMTIMHSVGITCSQTHCNIQWWHKVPKWFPMADNTLTLPAGSSTSEQQQQQEWWCEIA